MTEDEELAHALLSLICDRPGRVGRLRAARIIGGYDDGDDLDSYAVATTWTLAPLVDLVDDMEEQGLIARTIGARPTLVLTRHGFRSLEAMKGITS